MGTFNQIFNQMFDLKKENFGNLSEEFDQIQLTSKNHKLELHSKFNKMHSNMNNLNILINIQLKFKD